MNANCPSFQDQLGDSKQKVDKLKSMVRKCKEEEVHYQTEISHLRDEVKKRDIEMRHQRPERDSSAGGRGGADGAADGSGNLFHVSSL